MPVLSESPEEYISAASCFYEGRDPGHDLRHIRRIFSRLPELETGQHEAPDYPKLYFIAAFHGLASTVLEGSEVSRKITARMFKLGWSEDQVAPALDKLRTHLSDPQTVEQRMVHDANYFEVTGPFGIAKAFTVGGFYGQSYEETSEILLKNVRSVEFMRPFGRRVYEARRAVVEEFVRRLAREL